VWSRDFGPGGQCASVTDSVARASYLPFPERPAFDRAARGDDEVSAVRDRPAPFVRVAAGLGARRSRTRSDAPASVSVKFDVSRADCRGTAFCMRSFDPGRLRARRLAVLGSAPSFLLRFFSDMPCRSCQPRASAAASETRDGPPKRY